GRLVVAISVRVLLIVVLVVVLGHPKWLRRKDLGGYFFLETARCLQRLFARLGGPVLLRVVSEDGGVVGATLVTELAIRVERIDVAPKPVDELSIADLGGIEGDLHRLVVARGLGGDLLIGRPLDRAAGISWHRPDHPWHLFEGFLHAPEATARKGGDGDPGIGVGRRCLRKGCDYAGHQRELRNQPAGSPCEIEHGGGSYREVLCTVLLAHREDAPV